MSSKDSVVIETANTRVELSKAHAGSVVDVADKQTGHGFLKGTAIPLWEATLTTSGGRKTVSAKEAKQFHVDEEKIGRHGGRLVLTWSGFDRPFQDVKAVACVEYECPDSCLGFRLLRFDPGPENGLWQLDFPVIGGIREIAKDGQGDDLVIPLLQGLLVHRPISTILRNEKVRQMSYGSYPGLLTMQCFFYYNESIAGLYLASHDSLGYRKDFLFDSDEEGNGRFRVRNYPENMGLAGRAYCTPYSFALTTFRGGWPDGAEIYRGWATRQPWCRKGKLRRRGDVSNWFRDTSLWIWNRGKAERVVPGPMELKKRAGVNVALDWYWWHHNPYDVFVPEYLPPREGVKTFVENVDKLHSAGVKVVVYINGRLWDMTSGSWAEQGAELAAAKDENMKPYAEVYNISMPDHIIAPMCPTTQLWKDKVSHLVKTLVSDYGLDGVYIDQVAIAHANLCHDPSHGHPIGGGNYWIQGYVDLIRAARSWARKANGDACLLSESCIEQFIESFDGFLTLDSSWERTGSNLDLSWEKMGYTGQTWEPIPLFNAVYHDYAITFGSYTSMTGVPPYDDLWPESTRPPEYGKFVTYHDKYPDQFAFELARTFIWGIQPMVTNVYPDMLGRKEFDEDLAFLDRIVRFHSEAKEYLLLGKWLPPPSVDCERMAVKMYVRSIYTKKDRIGEFTRETLPVLSSAWQSEDGRCCVVLVNFSRNPTDALLRVDLGKFGFEPRDKVTMREYPDGKRETELGAEKPEIPVSVPARSVLAYEFSAE